MCPPPKYEILKQAGDLAKARELSKDKLATDDVAKNHKPMGAMEKQTDIRHGNAVRRRLESNPSYQSGHHPGSRICNAHRQPAGAIAAGNVAILVGCVYSHTIFVHGASFVEDGVRIHTPYKIALDCLLVGNAP
jgi:hypothetical protein